MNLTGLMIALAIACVVGIVFAIWPQLDLALAAPFFDGTRDGFPARVAPDWLFARKAANWIIALVAAPAFIALAVKLILPRRPFIIPGRAVLLLLVTLGLAPGIAANVVLKDNWGRPRPIDVTAFKGDDPFLPWWDPRGDCPKNCSFVAGEPSGAFWTLAAAFVAPPAWQPIAIGVSLAFGAATGLVRMAAGGHFFTDVVFAGVFTFLIIWTMHGIIYRWRLTRITDDDVDRAVGRPLVAIRDAVAQLFGRRKVSS